MAARKANKAKVKDLIHPVVDMILNKSHKISRGQATEKWEQASNVPLV